ncbi:NIPSNAP family protein [Rahnella sp. AA]|uniref:NIPSNAP family protein n=1 Tax=Rahnella sp. AA TaxID=2057180 RepID=UPI000C3423F8|nr:NIPSNAP family protein [Rahnella sp. AA]PKE31466.1 NIPSNAP family protein [Rahnella sp. AA]
MRIVEFLLYSLKKDSGAEFHRIMQEESIPLHRAAGMDVVAYGPSLHDSDSYHLIRAYDSLVHLAESQQSFYQSGDWRNGPREEIICRIKASVKSVVNLSDEAINGLISASV